MTVGTDVDFSKRDFALSTECMDPIIESPKISCGGDVTPIRLPSKPRDHSGILKSVN
ncbi:little elongation complex subunit 1-like [Drosophila ficusphila]|uniref:little elongation complex subunit 1-like n=1 Tax=Drosophila ficusphila TaxID=30025 RepID=UPI0007E661F3|nr:little elongation complex subunit 1-like [Drosophila ficusphila]